MALSGIISISGVSGLHKILSHTKNGLIVESLIDGKRRPVYSSQKVSSLDDISIYTIDDDVPLKDVLKLIQEKEGGKKTLDHKSDPAVLRKYLGEIVKDIDHERVYNSDVAKLFQWYNMLLEKDLLKFDEEDDVKDDEDGKSEKPKKKKATSKSKSPKKTDSKTIKAKSTPKKAVKIPAKSGRASKKG